MYIKRENNEFAVKYGNGDAQLASDETICIFNKLETAVDFMRCLSGEILKEDYHVRIGIRDYQKRLKAEAEAQTEAQSA